MLKALTWYTYIAEQADSTLHVGTTNNIKKKLKNTDGINDDYLITIHYTRSFKSRSEACKHEHRLKRYSTMGKLDIIQSVHNEVRKLQNL
jgi:predicted GIY-YIG superfamily endonuclease